MDGIKAYQDISAEIEVLQLRVEDLEISLEYAKRKMHGRLPNATQDVVITPLDKAVYEYNKVYDELDYTLNAIKTKKLILKQMEYNINNITDLHKAVEYQRDALGLPLKDIADRLGFAEGYIKNVSSRIPRRKYKSDF